MALTPVKTGLAGLGGYAANIRRLLLNERGQAAVEFDRCVELVAVCSSNPSRHPEAIAELESFGVDVMPSYEAMLTREDIEAVWLPLPIDMHLPCTVAGLEAGKAVMLEKPIAGSVQEVDEMIAQRDKHGLPVAVGFQDIYDPATVEVKRRLLDGQIGAIRSASLLGCWPRPESYYKRASWAGQFRKGESWVMDSPATNALAHFINLSFFFLGPDMQASVTPEHVSAELYRVNDIENYDTISARFTLPGGVPFQVMLTHAAEVNAQPHIRIEGEKGYLDWHFCDPNSIKLIDQDDKEIYTRARSDRPHLYMAERFTKLLRGVEDPDIALSTLENARPQILAVNGASEATAVVDVPESAWQKKKVGENDDVLRYIPGIAQTFEQALAAGKMLSEMNVYDWARPGGEKSLVGFTRFEGPVVHAG